jgi:hypothetical protein
MTVNVGFAVFDTHAPYGVQVGWAQFDALGAPPDCHVGWAQFDCGAPVTPPEPPPVQTIGGGSGPSRTPGRSVLRYRSSADNTYNIPISEHDETEEEGIVLALLMEVAQHELV